MNGVTRLISKEEAKKIYFECRCSWFYIDRETAYSDALRKAASDDDFRMWNDEYVLKEIENINVQDQYLVPTLSSLAVKDLSYSVRKKIYQLMLKASDVQIEQYLNAYMDFFLDYFGIISSPFHGYVYESYINKDFEAYSKSIDIMLNIISRNDEKMFKYYEALIMLNLVYSLNLDERLYPLMKPFWEEKYKNDMSYREYEWPVICYLTGIYVPKDYTNAYRSFKLVYDHYHNDRNELSQDYLNILNKITKLNLTIDDVIALSSFEVENLKVSDFDTFLDDFFKEEYGK